MKPDSAVMFLQMHGLLIFSRAGPVSSLFWIYHPVRQDRVFLNLTVNLKLSRVLLLQTSDSSGWLQNHAENAL